MKHKLLTALICCTFLIQYNVEAKNDLNNKVKPTTAPYSLTVFNEILFYDGYAATVSQPVPDGVIRHRNDLYARKLSDAELAPFGNTLTMKVRVKASCDNYDRIGNVNLALVPKGATTYVPAEVKRIEVGRFITPFMNKNVNPNEVPYTYTVNNVAKIFKDPTIIAQYDIWVELEVFGVPYAANTQVAGCAGRNDVFFGTLTFESDTDTNIPTTNNFLLPLSFKRDMNNYSATGTDVPGQTIRTIQMNLATPAQNAKLYLITSNHGANQGGEEYNRREHYIYFDNNEVLVYTPGGLSCEPFRMYNTQGNGIYGPTPRTDAVWASFSNWCPGDVIPIREIALGDLAAGTHTFMINVPAAQFVGQQGYIPVSLYLQAESGSLSVTDVSQNRFKMYPNPTSGLVTIESTEALKKVAVYNTLGQEVWKGTTTTLELSGLDQGVYVVQIEFENGQTITRKLVKR